ncbi:hypothetical protein ACFS2C_04045 [Prauserella oleivorans]|uniref:DUF4760 domain-containing protein n=1 Tax=Prauserella oleivorans TaxID=1478153 RepID=A0ABW5W509_9PSEU
MNTVSVVAATISVAGALVTLLLGALIESGRRRAQRREARRDLASTYSEPLLQAAASLASRLGNAEIGQITEFGSRLPERFRDYAVYESMYRFARYLCWVQIIASEVHFLDLGTRRRNRRLVEHLAAVQVVISDRHTYGNLAFQLLGGEQWALGSLLVEPVRDGNGRSRCMSYVEFRRRLGSDPEFRRWFEPLERDLNDLLDGRRDGRERLDALEAQLRRLIRFLDPARVWAPFDDAPATKNATKNATRNATKNSVA